MGTVLERLQRVDHGDGGGCRGADLFVVGTELDRTVQDEDNWRRLIVEVRSHTLAPITFVSNWDVFEKVPFWDAPDLVGIQSYFPISD